MHHNNSIQTDNKRWPALEGGYMLFEYIWAYFNVERTKFDNNIF